MSPLAELHLHLEGSIEPPTLCAIDPSLREADVLARYRYDGFPGFLESYKWVVRRLNLPEHYALTARALRERLAEHGVVYAELNVSVGVMLWRGQNARANVAAIQAELADWPLIFDAVRQHGGAPARAVAELALEFGAGFGIGGDETAIPMSEFTDAIRIVEGAFYPHAGETSEAKNVWEALEAGARRIGHGIRAIGDVDLCRELREREVPLEISISSNLATGAVESLEAHPAKRLFDLGVPIVLNTDDPAMFHTTLPREFELARRLGFTAAELEEVRQNAFRFARTS
jgi:adenosine deaminase/aminodeoxyfutalosine deaminase